jgi:hypothetical protein
MIILFIQKPMSKKSQNMLQQLINQKKNATTKPFCEVKQFEFLQLLAMCIRSNKESVLRWHIMLDKKEEDLSHLNVEEGKPSTHGTS